MMIQRLVVRLAALAVIAGPLAAQDPKPTPATGFQVGDQISLQVEGDTALSHTFTVGAGPALTLPVIGGIPLAGVQRAAVETYLTQQLGRYVKSPVVHAKALVRLSILGEVERPGFYAVPADAVMGDALRQATAQGMTIDQMNLHTGDQILVPREVRKDAETTWRIIGILVTLPVAIYGLTRLGH